MTEPVLVVHGVANRSRADFEATVASLQQRLDEAGRAAGRSFRCVPAFWGDLGGGDGSLLHDTLPPLLPGGAFGVRSDADVDVLVDGMLRVRRMLAMHEVRAEEDVGEIVARAAVARTARDAPSPYATRGGTPQQTELAAAIRDAVSESTFVKQVRDRDALAAIGEIVGASVTHATTPAIATRSLVGNVRDAAKRVIAAVDQLLGAIAGDAFGALNQSVRGALATATATSFGDIVAYRDSANGPAIRQRVLDALRDAGVDPQVPLIVAAHSLGGLVTLDLALAGALRARRFVTCGSQPAMFHVLKALPPLAPYAPGHRSRLPPSTIDAWTNLWHPMDLLAYLAATVFELSTGNLPRDVEIETPLSTIVADKLWMHSAYWESPELVEAIVQ